MKKKEIEIPEPTDFSPKAFKKRQRELALARAEIAYLKELEALDHQKQRQKEKSLLLYKKNRKRNGYRPMTFKLRQMGFHLNHKTVLKLMNELEIHSILRKKKHGKRGKA